MNNMDKFNIIELLKEIEKDIYVPSLESTFKQDAKSCAIHEVIEILQSDIISREHLISELETNLSYNRYDYSLEEFMSYVNDEPSPFMH